MNDTAKMGGAKRAGMTEESRSPLLHPLWWGSLAALAINDHVLKGAHVLPSSVTGKISDFAGLIVAPVLAAALLRARTDRARAIAFALVVVPFALIKLSEPAARTVEALAALVGVPSRIWTDPTDLVALVVLPIAWHLASGGAMRRRAARAIERVAIIAGSIACIATSQQIPDPTWLTPAFAINDTDAPIDIRLHWASATLDCSALEGHGVEPFGRELFDGAGITFQLEPGATVPLSEQPALLAAGMGATCATCPSSRPAWGGCEAVLVQVEGLYDTVVFFRNDSPRSVPTHFERGTALGEGALEIEGGGELLTAGAYLTLTAGPGLVAGPLVDRVTPSACEGSVGSSFEFTSLSLESGIYRLASVTAGADGCLALDVIDDRTSEAQTAFVCMPADLFPFVSGDVVELEEREIGDATEVGSAARELSIATARSNVRVLSNIVSLESAGLTGSIEPFSDCGGERTDCGAYVLPAAVWIDGVRKLAGERFTIAPDSAGRPGVVAIGRAEEVVVARDDCAGARDELSSSIDIAIVHREVE